MVISGNYAAAMNQVSTSAAVIQNQSNHLLGELSTANSTVCMHALQSVPDDPNAGKKAFKWSFIEGSQFSWQ